MRLLCGEDRHEVTVRESKSGLEVTVDSRVFEVRIEPIAPGSFLARHGDHVESFHCVREGDQVHLFWCGTAYRLTIEREGARSVRRDIAAGLEAPMPGKVIKLSVAPGQRVAKGDEVLVVEAMKMENALRAPRAGTVKSVSARVGDMVASGVVLVELE